MKPRWNTNSEQKLYWNVKHIMELVQYCEVDDNGVYVYRSSYFISIISHSDHKSLVTTGIHHHLFERRQYQWSAYYMWNCIFCVVQLLWSLNKYKDIWDLHKVRVKTLLKNKTAWNNTKTVCSYKETKHVICTVPYVLSRNFILICKNTEYFNNNKYK